MLVFVLVMSPTFSKTSNIKKKSKFDKNIFIWLGISANGASSVFLVPTGLSENEEVCMQTLIKRLLPSVS